MQYQKTGWDAFADAVKTTEQDRLRERLFGDPNRRVLNFSITRGDGPATTEEVCGQINHAYPVITHDHHDPAGPFRRAACAESGKRFRIARDQAAAEIA